MTPNCVSRHHLAQVRPVRPAGSGSASPRSTSLIRAARPEQSNGARERYRRPPLLLEKGSQDWRCIVQQRLGRVDLEDGRLDQAVQRFETMAEIARRRQTPLCEAEARAGLSDVAARRGNLALADLEANRVVGSPKRSARPRRTGDEASRGFQVRGGTGAAANVWAAGRNRRDTAPVDQRYGNSVSRARPMRVDNPSRARQTARAWRFPVRGYPDQASARRCGERVSRLLHWRAPAQRTTPAIPVPPRDCRGPQSDLRLRGNEVVRRHRRVSRQSEPTLSTSMASNCSARRSADRRRARRICWWSRTGGPTPTGRG